MVSARLGSCTGSEGWAGWAWGRASVKDARHGELAVSPGQSRVRRDWAGEPPAAPRSQPPGALLWGSLPAWGRAQLARGSRHQPPAEKNSSPLSRA